MHPYKPNCRQEKRQDAISKDEVNIRPNKLHLILYVDAVITEWFQQPQRNFTKIYEICILF